MNVFRFELRAMSRSLIGWILGIVSLSAVLLCLYPVFSKDVSAFDQLLQGFPEPIRAALGMDANMVSSVLGYWAFSFVYLSLCGGIQGMMLGMHAVARESMAKTADFIFTKPRSRASVLIAKMAASLAAVLITFVVFAAISVAVAMAVNDGPMDVQTFMNMTLCFLLVQIFFLASGWCLAAVLPKVRSVVSISMGAVFGFYILSAIGMTDPDDKLKYFTPFQYFDPSKIVRFGALDGTLLALGIAITIVLCIIATIAYTQKDIHAI